MATTHVTTDSVANPPAESGSVDDPRPKSRWSLPMDALPAVGIAEYSALAAVLGAVAYVVLSVACAGVYGRLGLSPDDVGLNYGALLARSGTFLAAITMVCITFIGVLVACTKIDRFIMASGWKGKHIWAWLIRIVAGVCAALVVGVMNGPVVSIAQGLMFIALLRLLREANQMLTLRRATAMVALMSTLLMVLATAGGAVHDGQRLKDGKPPTAIVFGARLPWSAQVVQVSWAEGATTARPVLPPCLLYLGQANDTSVFYQAAGKNSSDKRHALKLPTASVLVQVLPDQNTSLPATKKKPDDRCD